MSVCHAAPGSSGDVENGLEEQESLPPNAVSLILLEIRDVPDIWLASSIEPYCVVVIGTVKNH